MARVTRDRRTTVLIPHPSRPGSMVAFVALPAFLILLTLVSVPLRILPVDVTHSPTVDDAGRPAAGARSGTGEEPIASPSGTAATAAAASGGGSPCEPRSRVLEVATRAAGRAYRQDAAPQLDVVGDTCEVLLWRLPKKPGGYRVVVVDASGKVVSVRPGI